MHQENSENFEISLISFSVHTRQLVNKYERSLEIMSLLYVYYFPKRVLLDFIQGEKWVFLKSKQNSHFDILV